MIPRLAHLKVAIWTSAFGVAWDRDAGVYFRRGTSAWKRWSDGNNKIWGIQVVTL